jgi:para-aminobenzoate synthetase component I
LIRKYSSFPIADQQQTKMQMLNWGNRFNICCFLDNHNYQLAHNSIECVLACGEIAHVRATAGNAFSSVTDFINERRDWLFGHLAYDLKNEIETLKSSNPDRLGFPDLFLFVPRYILQLSSTSLSIGSVENDHKEVLAAIKSTTSSGSINQHANSSNIRSRYSKEQYVEIVEKLRQHILHGDCYEINFCQEFYIENIKIDPLRLYSTLSSSSPNPFSAYYKLNDRYLVCMSPERYLKREGQNILSQPIKGTSKRNDESNDRDLLSANNLRRSEKERAENIMVVDLVRNDLSRICEQGTVKVDELCEVYTFPQVHQMISTVSGRLKANVDFATAIKATFPMGSMTGAPKKKVMELIEKYEISRRGLFSGSIGYIDPEENFDFNVVIRSVLYNSSAGYLSFPTGSAITFNSDPHAEYEECLLKAEAIKKALAETNTFH